MSLAASQTYSNTRVIRAKYTPDKVIRDENFRVETIENLGLTLDKDQPNQVLLKNLYMALDPYVGFTLQNEYTSLPDHMRALNLPFIGLGISKVVLSSCPEQFPVGSLVTGSTGWEQYTKLTIDQGSDLRLLNVAKKDGGQDYKYPLENYATVFGMNGLTAYAGLKVLLQEEDSSKDFRPENNGGKKKVLFVASASGGVGQIVGQIAKSKGLFVIGSAGTDEKVKDLVNVQHFDASFNYKTEGSTKEALEKILKENQDQVEGTGLDYFFDLVGGQVLDTVLDLINVKGRILSVGMVSQENSNAVSSGGYAYKHLNQLAVKNVSLIGFIYWHYLQYWNELEQELGKLVTSGDLVYQQNVIQGVENSPRAFMDLLDGKYKGKVLIRIA